MIPKTLVQSLTGMLDYVKKLKEIAPESNAKVRTGDFSLMAVTRDEFESHVR